MLNQVNAETGGLLKELRDHQLLDLENRTNKVPGGFNTWFSWSP